MLKIFAQFLLTTAVAFCVTLGLAAYAAPYGRSVKAVVPLPVEQPTIQPLSYDDTHPRFESAFEVTVLAHGEEKHQYENGIIKAVSPALGWTCSTGQIESDLFAQVLACKKDKSTVSIAVICSPEQKDYDLNTLTLAEGKERATLGLRCVTVDHGHTTVPQVPSQHI